MGESLSRDDLKENLSEFYRYFDLTNNQSFLRQIGRISSKTWWFWADGIRTNLARPAFAASWEEIALRSNKDLAELRQVIHGIQDRSETMVKQPKHNFAERINDAYS